MKELFKNELTLGLSCPKAIGELDQLTETLREPLYSAPNSVSSDAV